MNILCLPIIMVLNFSHSINQIPKNSILKIQKDKYVVINHTVKPKETLYSLLKKYNNSAEDFYKLNPEIPKKSSLKIGQVIKFKSVIKPAKIDKIDSKKDIKNIPKVSAIKKEALRTEIIKLDPEKVKNHIVKDKETVFSISKMYGVSVVNLTDFNNLEDNLIYVGQSLALLKELKSEDDEDKDETPKIIPTGKVIKEKGIASVVVTGRRSSKMLALHRTAAIGSWITIKNEATGAVVQAKVIGNMSEKGIDEEILIKLSPAAYYKLKPKDSKLRAEVVYYEQ